MSSVILTGVWVCVRARARARVYVCVQDSRHASVFVRVCAREREPNPLKTGKEQV